MKKQKIVMLGSIGIIAMPLASIISCGNNEISGNNGPGIDATLPTKPSTEPTALNNKVGQSKQKPYDLTDFSSKTFKDVEKLVKTKQYDKLNYSDKKNVFFKLKSQLVVKWINNANNVVVKNDLLDPKTFYPVEDRTLSLEYNSKTVVKDGVYVKFFLSNHNSFNVLFNALKRPTDVHMMNYNDVSATLTSKGKPFYRSTPNAETLMKDFDDDAFIENIKKKNSQLYKKGKFFTHVLITKENLVDLQNVGFRLWMINTSSNNKFYLVTYKMMGTIDLSQYLGDNTFEEVTLASLGESELKFHYQAPFTNWKKVPYSLNLKFLSVK